MIRSPLLLALMLVAEVAAAQTLTPGQQEEHDLIEAIQSKGFTGGQVAEMRDLGLLMFQSRFCGESHTPAAAVERLYELRSTYKMYGDDPAIYRAYGESFTVLLLKHADKNQRDALCSLFPPLK